jgi:hypothetical protein
MVDTVARVNQTVAWISTGTGDTLTCSDIAPQLRGGVQIDADGITLESATITVTTKAGVTHVAVAPSGSGETCLVGQGFSISKIVLSGVSAGTYNVTFGQ